MQKLHQRYQTTTSSTDSYHAVIKAGFHTFPFKEDRAFKVVIRNLHHSTPISEIKNELTALGHMTHNIINVLQCIIKQPLPLFFVGLEPTETYLISITSYILLKNESRRTPSQTSTISISPVPRLGTKYSHTFIPD
jgi:hypothetical protein